MTFDRHEVTNGDDNFLNLLSQLARGSEDEGLAGFDVGIDFLENGDGEGGSLSCSRLGLGDNVGACTLHSTYVKKDVSVLGSRTFDDRHDSSLLNSGWALKAICIDTCMV